MLMSPIISKGGVEYTVAAVICTGVVLATACAEDICILPPAAIVAAVVELIQSANFIERFGSLVGTEMLKI